MSPATDALSRLIGLPLTAASLLRTGEVNPLFDPSPREIDAQRHRMRRQPVRLERPVVVLSGYRSWPAIAANLRARLTRLTSHDPADFLSVAYTLHGDLDRCVHSALDAIQRRFPSDDPERTRELDVVAVSMGGLVARRAAQAPAVRGYAGRRLHFARLFTLGTPHRGALLAERIAPEPAAVAMKPGSPLLRSLDGTLPEVDGRLTPYAVTNDTWVGATRSAPPGSDPIWSPGAITFSHFAVSEIPAIVTDVALCLRDEPPLSRGSSPPPRD